MPATTGISAIPSGRPGVEGQAGFVPSYFLSSSVTDGRGSTTGQAALLVEPDRWIGAPGLVLGGRLFGDEGDTPIEPLLGYRRALDEGFAVAVIGYGTSKRSSANGASYRALRAGAEVAADGRLVAFAPWLSLHTQAAVAVTGLSASGTYCVGSEGQGVDCSEDDPSSDTVVDGEMSGLYPSGTVTLSLDLGRTPSGVLHSARLAVMMAGGLMPTAVNGVQEDARGYVSIGATLTLGLGAAER